MPQSDTLDILERLIAFDTVSSRSNIALIEFIEQYLAKLNLTGIRSGSEPEHKANLIVTIGPPNVPGIILSGHTDVVPVDGQAWTSPPFTATRVEHRIYGRGTADMKGFLACVLAVAPHMCQAKLKRPIYLAFSYDEEIGCLGVRHLLPWLRDLPQRPIACIVGEPTSMEVIVAHKSSRSFRVTVTGLEGHSSRAPESVNAVEYAARLIVFISDLGRRLASSGMRDELFDIPFTTTNTGLCQGGIQINIVPVSCTFMFEFRSLPDEDADALIEEVRSYADSVLLPQMRAVYGKSDITITPASSIPALNTDPGSDVVSLVKTLAGRNSHAKVAYGTEAGLFAGEAGIPSVVCGPGSIGVAHKPDEYIEDRQLELCELFLDRLIGWASA